MMNTKLVQWIFFAVVPRTNLVHVRLFQLNRRWALNLYLVSMHTTQLLFRIVLVDKTLQTEYSHECCRLIAREFEIRTKLSNICHKMDGNYRNYVIFVALTYLFHWITPETQFISLSKAAIKDDLPLPHPPTIIVRTPYKGSSKISFSLDGLFERTFRYR